MIIDGLAIFLLCAGTAFLLLGSIGIVRFPDFYSRMHPAGKLDTAGQSWPPPSTRKTWPVIYDDGWVTKNSTTRAISSGQP